MIYDVICSVCKCRIPIYDAKQKTPICHFCNRNWLGTGGGYEVENPRPFEQSENPSKSFFLNGAYEAERHYKGFWHGPNPENTRVPCDEQPRVKKEGVLNGYYLAG